MLDVYPILPERKPKVFISTSLRVEDKDFCNLITKLVKDHNFEPSGTIGKYSQSPQPLLTHMIENVQNTDCVVMVATPRYIQTDYHDPNKTTLSISDLVQSEGIIATILGKPVLIFASGVDISSIFKSTT
jgi:hypothetical protein